METPVDPQEAVEVLEANAEVVESIAEHYPQTADLISEAAAASSASNEAQMSPESGEIIVDDKVKQPKPTAPPLESAETHSCGFCHSVNSFLCPAGQKQLCDLTLLDLVLWKNVPVSAIVFALGQVLYVLLQLCEISIITLVSRCLFIPIVLAFIYVIARRAIKNQAQEPSEPTQSVELTEEMFKPYVDALIAMLNGFIKYYLSVLFCGDIWKTLRFAFLVHLVATLGTVFSTTNLIYIAFCLAFSVPKFYTVYKQQIDAILAKCKSHANELIQTVKSKIHSNSANPAPAHTQKRQKTE